MSDENSEKQLPVRVTNEFSELAVPQQFRGTTSIDKTQKAYHSFELCEKAGDSFATLCSIYKGVKSAQTPSITCTSLQKKLEKNSLAEYRKQTGLDNVREKLKSLLLSSVSVEKGIEKILEHMSGQKRNVLKMYADAEILSKLNLSNEAHEINSVYPCLTAQELAWLSLAKIPDNWLCDKHYPVFYPVGIVDADIDGLRFAPGTIDERLEDTVNATNAYQIVGISGVSHQYQLVPFEHNVSKIIRAIILLSIDDKDVFDKIWKEQDVVALQRGDAMLIKSFMKNRKYENCGEPLEDLIAHHKLRKADIDILRAQLVDYFCKSTFRDSCIQNCADFVKLTGMLSRVPNFVQEEKHFAGFVKPYGKNIEFISEDGSIADSVPIAEHLLIKASYQFHDNVTEAGKKNEVMKTVLKELQQKIDGLVIRKNHMAADVLQEMIFENYGVFIPSNIHTSERKYTPEEMFLAKSKEDIFIDRKVKFSLYEMYTVKEILDALPKGFTGNIRTIFKEVTDAETIDCFRSGTVLGGHYNTHLKRIVVGLPWKSPDDVSYLELAAQKINSNKIKYALQNIELHKSHFVFTLLHEIGESLWAKMNKESKKQWTGLYGKSKKESPSAGFLTPYARTSHSEDFCDTFAAYYAYGTEFRQRANSSKLLAEKYEYMKRFWSSDGTNREFTDNCHTPLIMLAGNPDRSLERIMLEDFVKDVFDAEDYERHSARAECAENVLSYEDLARIAEDEEITIKQAEEKYKDKNKYENDIENKHNRRMVSELVIRKTRFELHNLKAGIGFNDTYCFERMLYFGQREASLQWLQQYKVDIFSAEQCVDRLLKLYKYFESYLEHFAKDIAPDETNLKGIVMGMKEWSDRERKNS